MNFRGYRAVLLAVAAVGISTLAAADANRCQYVETALTDTERAELKASLPALLEKDKARLETARQMVRETFKSVSESFQADRVKKRMFMARRLVAFIEDEIAHNDTTGLCRAEAALDDLDELIGYFELECAAYATYPETPLVRPVRLNVRDFGAKGDGVSDDFAAFTNAFAAVRALKGKPSVLFLPEGAYLIVGDGGFHQRHFDTGAISNCVIAGAAAETTKIVAGRYDGDGFLFTHAYNSTLRDVQVHLRDTPFVEGTVESVDRTTGSIVIRHHPNTLKPNDPRFKRIGHANSCVLFGADKKPIRKDVLWYNYVCDDLGGDRYRMYFAPEYGSTKKMNVDVGATFVFPDRDNAIQLLKAADSVLFTFQRVWVRNSRAGTFTPGICRYPSIVNCRILPLRDEYCLSSNADGGFSPSGVYMHGCDFTNMNDDGVNSHSSGKLVVAKIDPYTLEHDPFWQNERPGQLATFVRSMDGMYLGRARVKSCRIIRRDGVPIGVTTFDRPVLDGVKSWQDMSFDKYTALERRAIYIGTKKTPDFPDQFYLTHAPATGFVCTDNRFSNLRGVAIQIQCANAFVCGNVIDSAYRGIEISGLLHYQEGPAPYNVFVCGNRIGSVARGIKTCFMTVNHPPAASSPFAGVTIESNAMERIDSAALVFHNLDNPTVRGNTLDGKPIEPKDAKK